MEQLYKLYSSIYVCDNCGVEFNIHEEGYCYENVGCVCSEYCLNQLGYKTVATKGGFDAEPIEDEQITDEDD